MRVLIADDHPLFREGVRRVLKEESRFQVVGDAVDGEQTVKLTTQLRPDILLLDLAMPRRSGMDALRQMSPVLSSVRCIVLAASVEPAQVVEALRLGARGVVLKECAPQLLIRSINAVMAGQYWVGHGSVADLVQALRQVMCQEVEATRQKTFGLTPREIEIISLVVAAYTNHDIAQKFAISEDTVKRHFTNIFDKLGVSNRLELALFAIKNHLAGSP